MAPSRSLVAAALLALAGCHNPFPGEPGGHGPQWVERPVSDLVDTLGKPDRMVRVPAPSLSTAYLYSAGTQPGFAICEHDYFIRGTTVVGYREHGSDPNCKRSAGNTD